MVFSDWPHCIYILTCIRKITFIRHCLTLFECNRERMHYNIYSQMTSDVISLIVKYTECRTSIMNNKCWKHGLFMVINATFNNISVILWRSVLLVEETGVPRENHRRVASHWQTLSHNVVSSTPRHEQESHNQQSRIFHLFIYSILKHWNNLFYDIYDKTTNITLIIIQSHVSAWE